MATKKKFDEYDRNRVISEIEKHHNIKLSIKPEKEKPQRTKKHGTQKGLHYYGIKPKKKEVSPHHMATG